MPNPLRVFAFFKEEILYATRHIDWLSVTVPSRSDVDRMLPNARWHYIGPGHHGYQSAFEDEQTGARVETDSPVEGMDTHLTMSGQALHVARTWFPDGDAGLLARARESGARASRLDLAINAHDSSLTVRDFYDAFKSGDLTTPMRRAYYVEGIGHDRAGDTFYFGSPKSDRQCRIYNKAAEQGIMDGEAWLRLELALRNLRAKSALGATEHHSVEVVISSHMEDALAWSSPDYLECMGGLSHPVEPIKRKPSKTESWLLNQCAPALARVYAVRPDFMVEFLTKFRQSLDKLSASD